MAKAKSGGTRSFLRGRVGADVYSIGKDAKGNKQQIVRSLAESVANPQTLAQMRGRMIMSSVMQAVSGMSMIIDHSFDNVPAGQPCVSEFIRRNYALVKADVAANPAAGNQFGLNKYGEKGIKQGAYVIAAGSAADIAGVAVDAAAKTLTISLASGATIADLRAALGIGTEDYFTLCAITADNKFIYERFHVTQSLPSATPITGDNIGSVITLDGNVSVSLALSAGNIVATLGNLSANYGIIVSRKENATYKHNDCVLAAPADPTFTSDDALPTYPTGAQRFLNGGGEEVTPFSPTPTDTIDFKGWKWGGDTTYALNTSGAAANTSGQSIEIGASGEAGPSDYKVMLNGSKSVSGATEIVSVTQLPMTFVCPTVTAGQFIMMVKNGSEILGAIEVVQGGD